MQREVPTSGRKRSRERLFVLKREPLGAKRPSWRKTARDRIVVLKREPLDAKRISPVREEEMS